MTAYLKLKASDSELYEEQGQEENKKMQIINQQKSSWITFFKKCYYHCVIWIKYILHIITIKQIYQANILIFPLSKKEEQSWWQTKLYQYHMKRCINKVEKIIQKDKIDMIILSDDLKNDEFFLQYFLEKRKNKPKPTLLDGKGVFPYLILEIIEYILQKQEKQMEREDIYLLMHDHKEIYIDNILFLMHHFKTVNIVTDHLRPFQLLAEKIEQKEGIPITVSNNTKKSLKKAKVIVNFDFQEEKLQQYVMYRRAILLQASSGLSYENPTFEGIQVHHIDIDTSQEIKDCFEKYHLLRETTLINLYEGILHQKESFLGVRRQLKDHQVKVLNLYGKNGIIDLSEYKRINTNQLCLEK